VALNNFPIATLLIHRTATVTAGGEAVLSFLLVCLGTALFEELLFRGFLLPLCLDRLGYTRRGRFLSVLLSSAVFGAFHLLNLLAGADPGATLLQVGYSFLIGCVAAVLCCVTGRLLVPILFHFVYNAGGYLVPRLGQGPLFDTPTVLVTVFLSLGCAALAFLALFEAQAQHTGGKNQ
jgi:membrane protease YdiL (CAAX protease family)